MPYTRSIVSVEASLGAARSMHAEVQVFSTYRFGPGAIELLSRSRLADLLDHILVSWSQDPTGNQIERDILTGSGLVKSWCYGLGPVPTLAV